MKNGPSESFQEWFGEWVDLSRLSYCLVRLFYSVVCCAVSIVLNILARVHFGECSVLRQRLFVFISILISFTIVVPSFVAAQQNGLVVRPKVDSRKLTEHSKRVKDRNQQTVSLIAGGVTSTNLRMAAEMATAIDGNGVNQDLRVVPIVGKGGVQNVLDILYLKGVDMGMVQQGQLTYMEKSNPKLFGDIKKRIHYITKLHNAEFHMLVPKSVRSIKQLKGQRVSIGIGLGSTDMISRVIFDKLDILIKPVNEEMAAGIANLKLGEVTGVAILGGAPIHGLNSFELGANFHFLAISPKTVGLKAYFNLVDEFLPTKIYSKHYPGLVPKGTFVPSVSSGVIMVVYNWAPKTKRYKKLKLFVSHFFDRFDAFLHPAWHPKWHEVSLAAKMPGLTRFGPATEWLEKRQQLIGQEVSAGEMKIAMDAFVRQYSKVWKVEQVTPLQRDDIWAAMDRVFGRWWAVKNLD